MQVASTVATVAVAVAVLGGDGDVVTFVGVLVVARASVASGGVLLTLNGLRGDDSIDPPAVRNLARFGLGVAVAEIGAWSVQLADRLIYGHYGDAGSLGAYAAVYTAASLISVLGGAVFLPAFPALARAWAEGGEERLQQVVADVHRHLVVIVVPAVALVLVVARPALDLIGRGDVDPGALVVTFVVVSIGISQWNGPARFVLVAVEGARAVRLGWFAGMAVSIVAGFALIPPFGLIGAATSTLVAYATVDVIFALRANRWAALRRTYAWRGTIRSSAAAGVAAAVFEVIRLTLPASLPALALATAAFVVSFVGALALTRRGPLGRSAAAVPEDDRHFLHDAGF